MNLESKTQNPMQDPRIIIALDFPSDTLAFSFIEKLDPKLCRLKVGITLFTRCGPAFIESLMQKGFSIFLDLKFHDIPNQVAGACRSAAELGVWMLTIHTLGGSAMCEAAAHAISSYRCRPYLVGVTILTSANQADLLEIGIEKDLDASVYDLAALAEKNGLDGIVCSPLEVSYLREKTKKEFLFVTPGIRLEFDANDDQKRTMTPQAAFDAGSSYIVMGRSITQAKDPCAVLKSIYKL